MTPELLQGTTWLDVLQVRNQIAHRIWGWHRFQIGRLYADGAEIHAPLWVRVPISRGLKPAYTAMQTDAKIWINTARGGFQGTVNGASTSIQIDHFPFDDTTDLEHSFTFIVADQRHDGEFLKTLQKRLIHIEENDFSLVELILRHVLLNGLVGRLFLFLYKMRQTHLSKQLQDDYVVHVFFRTSELRCGVLDYLSLVPLLTYDQASQFTRLEVMDILNACHTWIVGSVALAALLFSCHMPVPENMNIISTRATHDSWVASSVASYVSRFCPRSVVRASTLRRRAWADPSSDQDKTLTLTTSRGLEITELFLRARTTLMTNAISAQEIVSTYPELTSNLEGTVGYMTRSSVRLRSPFLNHITLHRTTKFLGCPCGLACPAKPRWSTEAIGCGGGMDSFVGDVDDNILAMADSDVKYRTGGLCGGLMRELHHFVMVDSQKIEWPETLSTQLSVVEFLNSKTTPALATDIVSVEFVPGRYGSYALDETAYTNDNGTPYHTFVLGKVCGPVLPPESAQFYTNGNRRLRISKGEPEDTELNLVFERQLKQLAMIVKEADEEDYELNQVVRVVRTRAAINALRAAAEPQLSRKPLKPAIYKWLGSALGGDGSGAIKSQAKPAAAEPRQH
ncbi:hypothetical protein K438DRAFT_2058800 [Mycena galopus ATCC 62051]|nr:hypothetical protein K438DRAFT_2058800 [Mycena galopus ATCC 62051]